MSHADEDPRITASVMKDLAIPPRPAVVLTLQEEMARDEPDMLKVKRTIAGDVGLAAAILKVVNSASFGLQRKIGNVPQAIDVIGLRNVANIATAMALRQQLGRGGASLERFWDTAEKVAHMCAYLAKRLGGISPNEAYTYGLFHNCGIAVLMHRFPNYREALIEANQAAGQRFTTVEERSVGTHHAVVGYFLSRSWSLSSTMCRAILLHHELDVFSRELKDDPASLNFIAIGHFGEHIHHRMTRSSEDIEWNKFEADVLRHFALDDEELVNLIDGAEEFAS
jgi:HD-like signal output (HDOD) protein